MKQLMVEYADYIKNDPVLLADMAFAKAFTEAYGPIDKFDLDDVEQAFLPLRQLNLYLYGIGFNDRFDANDNDEDVDERREDVRMYREADLVPDADWLMYITDSRDV